MPTPSPYKAQTPDAIRAALANALTPQGELSKIFAQELHQRLPWMHETAAQQSADDIMQRRHAEVAHNVPSKPSDPRYPKLPQGKCEELVEWLAQPKEGENPNADALIHIHANRHIQYELHAALAEHVFRKHGPFEQTLAQELAKQLPAETPPQMIAQTAEDFVAKRRERAEGVTEALIAHGPVEQAAVSMAERLRRASDISVLNLQPTSPETAPASTLEQLWQDITTSFSGMFGASPSPTGKAEREQRTGNYTSRAQKPAGSLAIT